MGLFSKSFDPDADLPDLTGKVAIVTGGNAGIGYATVKLLARKGARVYLAARNKEKAEAALERLESDGTDPGNGVVTFIELNLDNHRSAKSAAEEFLNQEDRLDILVNNAALFNGPYTKNVDGISDIMMINHFSPFVFTETLLPLMKQTAQETDSDVRIVNVSSIAHKRTPNQARFRNLDDINQEFAKAMFPGFARYAYSKLATILWTKELQKRLDAGSISIIAMAVHPGGVNTFSDKLPSSIKSLGSIFLKTFLKTPDEGAFTSVIAAASADIKSKPEKYKGAYLEPNGVIATPSKSATNAEWASELWETTENILAEARKADN